MNALRRIRGIVGTALAWGVAWIPLTLVFWGTVRLFGVHLPPVRDWGPLLFGAAFRGAVTGAVFAGVLAVAARRRTFGTLRFRQMLLWGGFAGSTGLLVTIAPLLLGRGRGLTPAALAVSLGFSGVLGAVSAVATLYAARRAPALAESPDAAALNEAPFDADQGLRSRELVPERPNVAGT